MEVINERRSILDPVRHVDQQNRVFIMEKNGKDGHFHLTIIHILCRILIR